MARYTAESKERVRDAVDMIDLVGARTELRRAGADSYTGLCPFHDERTPSFSVQPSGKVYYCFGCQEAGDAFNFAMATEGLDFVGALEFLADRYASYDTGLGKQIEKGEVGFRELEKLVLGKLGEPELRSGRQEYLENLFNSYLTGR